MYSKIKYHISKAKSKIAVLKSKVLTKVINARPKEILEEYEYRVKRYISEIRRTRANNKYKPDYYFLHKKMLEDKIIRYFNLKSHGLENIPDDGCMIVANHPGHFFLDALCLTSAIHKSKVRYIAHHFDFKIPGLTRFLRKYSAIRLDDDLENINESSEIVTALRNKELLCIWPEESYHTYKERYTLFHFDTKLARYCKLSGKPAIPAAIIGVEECFKYLYGPKIKKWPFHIPIGFPIPSRSPVTIEFGKPVYYDHSQTEMEFTERVKKEIYNLIIKYRSYAKMSDENYLHKHKLRPF
jgi:1-acyl-sn-glycerol-3-phosphate acyltransferase